MTTIFINKIYFNQRLWINLLLIVKNKRYYTELFRIKNYIINICIMKYIYIKVENNKL